VNENRKETYSAEQVPLFVEDVFEKFGVVRVCVDESVVRRVLEHPVEEWVCIFREDGSLRTTSIKTESTPYPRLKNTNLP
jgi:hypothetical protein